uniref:Vacuolar-sorting protein SNF8 n=1 Tax=Zonotrichia albicollis TaxID=44394 RepID=A0A8D2M3V7_ZONAL
LSAAGEGAGQGIWGVCQSVCPDLGCQSVSVSVCRSVRPGTTYLGCQCVSPSVRQCVRVSVCPCRDDLLRAIRKLKVLGSGFGIIPVGGTVLVQSVPAELSMDHTVVLQLAEKKGFVTVSEIRDSLKWETERAKQVLDHLLKEGMAWLDAQAPAEPQFWLPALFSELHGQDGT